MPNGVDFAAVDSKTLLGLAKFGLVWLCFLYFSDQTEMVSRSTGMLPRLRGLYHSILSLNRVNGAIYILYNVQCTYLHTVKLPKLKKFG